MGSYALIEVYPNRPLMFKVGKGVGLMILQNQRSFTLIEPTSLMASDTPVVTDLIPVCICLSPAVGKIENETYKDAWKERGKVQ